MDSIIFDVDGTLWDATGIVAEMWTQYLQNERGLDITITAERLQSLFGRLMKDIAANLFSAYTPDEQLQLMHDCCMYENEVLCNYRAPLYEGWEDTLKILSQKMPLFIVSNCHPGYIEVFLEATGFHNYFKGHLCPSDTGKDKAGNIAKIIEDYNLKDPVYVGDTMGDHDSCKKVGIPFMFPSPTSRASLGPQHWADFM